MKHRKIRVKWHSDLEGKKGHKNFIISTSCFILGFFFFFFFFFGAEFEWGSMELAPSIELAQALLDLKQAFRADLDGAFEKAVVKYMDGAPALMDIVKQDQIGTTSKALLKGKCQLYLDRLRTIKAKLDKGWYLLLFTN